MAIQYNAMEYAQQLEAAGVPNAQAEVHAKTLGHVLGDCVAVPAGLYAMKADLTHELRETETRLRSAIAITSANLRSEIVAASASLHSEIANSAAGLRVEIAKAESRLAIEIVQSEARLNEKILNLAARMDTLEVSLRAEMRTLKWMNGLTLAVLVGWIVKSSFP
jgi:hypothetical protein